MVTFAQMPKYEAYKDSGVDWLGKVPEEWGLVPIRAVLAFRNEKNDPVKTENILSLSIAHGVTRYSDKGRGGNKRKDDLTAYKIARPNDIVMNSMNIIVGAVGVSKYFGAISPVYYALYAKNKSVSISYYERIFQDVGFQRGLLRLGKGILIKFGESGKMNTIRMKVSQDDIKTLVFPMPDTYTQSLIANFLDQKTAQIDAAIAIKEQQIELLKERKQIIIQQAVTQGLDPNVPMKDSGVEWIGQIPEHWEVKKLKHGLLLTNDKIESKKSQLKYLGMESVQAATGLLSGVDSEADGLANVFHSGQILFGKLRPYLAKVYLAEFDGVCSTEFLVFDVKANYDRGYVSKLLLSDGFIKTVDASTYGSKMPRANPNFILNILLPTPPAIEQLQIHEYINNVSSATDLAIINTVKQIQKLKEYKTTLINSAVTGKIKVTPEMLQA